MARLQPSIDRPVFPDYDLSLQYEVMDIVGRNSDIPVPELRGLETDKSLLGVQFYLMKRTEGRIPSDMPPYNMDGWMVHETSIEQRQFVTKLVPSGSSQSSGKADACRCPAVGR